MTAVSVAAFPGPDDRVEVETRGTHYPIFYLRAGDLTVICGHAEARRIRDALDQALYPFDQTAEPITF